MKNNRMEKGFEHLREAMASALSAVVEFPMGVFVTVLEAKMTANTAHARFTLSVLPETAEKEVLETLERFRPEIKDKLSQLVRLRRIPQLHYAFDHTEAVAAGVEEELNRLERAGEL
jgi:ribosome-binding factor A